MNNQKVGNDRSPGQVEVFRGFSSRATQSGNCAIQDKLKTTMASLSEQHKVETAAAKEDKKLEMNALSEPHIKEIVSVHVKLNTVIQGNKWLKSAKSLVAALSEKRQKERAAIQGRSEAIIQSGVRFKED
jgi:hypothetical protein